MKFFLHIGTEKTGSSFIQSLMTLGRSELLTAGLFVPQGTRRSETAATQGRISAGNGELLASMIEQENWSQVKNYIDECTKNVQEQNCQRVLISSERLLSPLSSLGRLEKFQKTISESGVVATNFLLIVWVPVSRAISLYKHRSKSGRAEPSVTAKTEGSDRN